MFDKNEFLEEYELSQEGINQKKRTIIVHIMNELRAYELEEINPTVVDNICQKVENIEFLFKTDKTHEELFSELDFNLYQCLNYWDDGFFDNFTEHFAKFLKIKLNI